MELIERYVQEVGRLLPKKGRADVEDELRSLLIDTVEDRIASGSPDSKSEIVTAVLQEFGPPENLAASYQPHRRYLVGPTLYATFLKSIGLVTAILAIIYLTGIGAATRDSLMTIGDWGGFLMESAVKFLQSTLASLGMIVLIFALVERVMFEKQVTPNEKWHPGLLPASDSKRRISIAEILINIVGGGFVIFVFNVYPEWIGAFNRSGGVWERTPLLSESFFSDLVPWLTVLWTASVVFNAYLLRQRSWTLGTRAIQLGLNLLPLIATYRFARYNPLFSAEVASVPGMSALAENVHLLLLALIMLTMLDVIKKLVQIATPEGGWSNPKMAG